MRTCIYCNNDISHRDGSAKYCNRNCGINYRASKKFDSKCFLKKIEGKVIYDEVKNMFYEVYINSSFEAMREFAGLKNVIIKQAIDFRDLIKPKTVMSNFE